jgi:hypothetical protein
MTWPEVLSMFVGLLGVGIGAWLAPYVSSYYEKIKQRRALKPELIKFLFSYYRLLKEKAEIVNTLSMDERATVLIDEKLQGQTSDRSELDTKRQVLLEKMNRKNLQNDHVSNALTDVESSIHSLVVQIGVYYKADIYNECIDILKPFFLRVDKAPYLYDYINLPGAEYNRLAGDVLQKEIIVFGKELQAERAALVNGLIKANF